MKVTDSLSRPKNRLRPIPDNIKYFCMRNTYNTKTFGGLNILLQVTKETDQKSLRSMNSLIKHIQKHPELEMKHDLLRDSGLFWWLLQWGQGLIFTIMIHNPNCKRKSYRNHNWILQYKVPNICRISAKCRNIWNGWCLRSWNFHTTWAH